MVKKAKWAFILFLLWLPFGCAHVISKDIRAQTNPMITFKRVSQDPNAYRGRTVVWGGEIIETQNQKDGSTLIEVFQRPLDGRDAPELTDPSGGRFLIRFDTYLDPYDYSRGRKITVGGEILGEEVRPLGNMDYHYPLVLSKQVYLWDESYYYPYAYSYPYYYDPWWVYPYWGWPPYGFQFYYYGHPHRRH
jgi:outer membrane lipoprotein